MVLAMFASASGPADQLANRINDLMKWKVHPVDMTRWTAGSTQEIELTLVTADYDKLGCVLDREIAGARCEYKTETEKWPHPDGAPLDDNKKNVIQPYSAVPDNALIFVAGLWAQPTLAMRLHQEPWEGTDPKRLARFIARCRVKPIERVGGVKLRWNSKDKWQEGRLKIEQGQDQARYEDPWVAVAESCTVED